MSGPFTIPLHTILVRTGLDDNGHLSYDCGYLVHGSDDANELVPWLMGLGMIDALRCDFIAQHQRADEESDH